MGGEGEFGSIDGNCMPKTSGMMSPISAKGEGVTSSPNGWITSLGVAGVQSINQVIE